MSLQSLDPIQLAAVKSSGKKVLCNSKAGSGKTRILMNRCLWLMENGAKAEEIMLVTFTNKAAKEMMTRINKLSEEGKKITCGTFHGIALIFLKEFCEEIGYDKNFTVLSPDDCKKKLKTLIKDLSVIKGDEDILNEKSLSVQKLLTHYSSSRNLNIDFETYLLEKRSYTYGNAKMAKEIMEFYQLQKESCNQMDFDDILENFKNLLYEDELREKIVSRYKHIMVDEYQDINTVQHDIISLLTFEGNELFVVGDPYQCIYGFRGSKIEFIDTFDEKYECDVYNVNNNYRSTKKILKVASGIIGENIIGQTSGTSDPLLALFWSDAQQAEYIANIVKSKIDAGENPREISILVRSTINLSILEQALRRKNIMYELRAGFSYFERAHIKDVLSILTILINPKDKDAVKRVLGLFNGFGEKTIDKCVDYIVDNNLSILEFSNRVIDGTFKLTKKGVEGSQKLNELFSSIDASKSIKYNIEEILTRFYNQYAVENFEDESVRINDIVNLKELSSKYTDIGDFIRDSMLDTTQTGEDVDAFKNQKIVLSTIHRAKGLEWDNCIIANFDPSFNMRSSNDDEDEENFELSEDRRLLYVAVTRAKKDLIITANRQSYNNHHKNKLNLSYLLNELIIQKEYR